MRGSARRSRATVRSNGLRCFSMDSLATVTFYAIIIPFEIQQALNTRAPSPCAVEGVPKMMHADNLVAAIKVNGQVLRESNGEVCLPFGCEYSILIKNLNSVRVQVSVSVDGVSASGENIIILPNSDLELERFIRDGNLQSGNRLKFIERTANIEAHRGVKVDDGIVRVEGWRERLIPPPAYVPPYYTPYPPTYRGPLRGGNATYGALGPRPRPHLSAKSASSGGPRPSHPTSRGRSEERGNMTRGSMGNPGITVPGSESGQRFYSAMGFPMESQSSVLVLHLRGQVGAAIVTEPLTVDFSPICSTCGKTNRQKNKFCFDCGTALQLI